LPRTQKAAVVQAEMQMLQFLGGMVELIPDIIDVVDTDKMTRNIAINLGVPALDLRGEEEMMQIRQERQAEVQRQQKLMELQQAGQAMQQMGAGTQAMNENPDSAAAIEAMQ
jgi:hypothetical protein